MVGRIPYGEETKPFSIRLTDSEKERLTKQASPTPLSRYIRDRLLLDEAQHRRKRRSPVADQKLLAETLACLGGSRLAESLKRLSKAAELGNLAFDPDAATLIRRASDDIHAMRYMLMQALGMKVRAETPADETLSQRFARASTNRRAQS